MQQITFTANNDLGRSFVNGIYQQMSEDGQYRDAFFDFVKAQGIDTWHVSTGNLNVYGDELRLTWFHRPEECCINPPLQGQTVAIISDFPWQFRCLNPDPYLLVRVFTVVKSYNYPKELTHPRLTLEYKDDFAVSFNKKEGQFQKYQVIRPKPFTFWNKLSHFFYGLPEYNWFWVKRYENTDFEQAYSEQGFFRFYGHKSMQTNEVWEIKDLNVNPIISHIPNQ